MLAPLAVAWGLLPTREFGLILGLILLLATWEWTALAGMTRVASRIAAVVAVAGALGWVLWLPELERPWMVSLLGLLALGWLALAVYLFSWGSRVVARPGPLSGLLLWAIPVLLGAGLAMIQLHASSPHGPYWVLFLLALIWTADSAAYFAGRRWGTTRLAPTLSPGKTWAGVYGALASAGLLALALAWQLALSPRQAALVLFWCLTTVLLSVVGDLFESLIKRRCGVKDSGSLLPGHGGVLDRIDSLLAATPLFALGVFWLEGRW